MRVRTPEQKHRKVLYAAKRRNRRKHHLNRYKERKGCAECGYNAQGCALDFDHLDRSTKIAPVSRLALGSLKKLFLEIRKCQVLCRNCHQIKSTIEEKEIHARVSL